MRESFIGNEVMPYLMDARDQGIDISTRIKAAQYAERVALTDKFADPVAKFLMHMSDQDYRQLYSMLETPRESKMKEGVFDLFKKKEPKKEEPPLKFKPIKKHGSVKRLVPGVNVREQVTIMKPSAVDDKIAKQFLEWRQKKQAFAILNLLAGKVAARLDELEKDIRGIVKEVHGQQVNIDDAVAAYKSKKTTSTSYKTVFEKALAMMNADQGKVLSDFKESITKRGTSESIKIVDPKLEAFLNQLNNTPVEELLKMAKEIQEIPDLPPMIPKGKPPEEALGGVVKIAGHLLQQIKDGFNKVWSSLSKGKESAMNLLRVAQGNESLTRAEKLLGNIYEIFEVDNHVRTPGKNLYNAHLYEAQSYMIRKALDAGFQDEGEDTETGWHSFFHPTDGLYLDIGPNDEWKLQASTRYGSRPVAEGEGADELVDFLAKNMR